VSALQVIWVASLLVTLAALPVGAIRMLAYQSGETDHTPGLRSVAWIALGIGLLGLAVLAVTSVILLTR